MSRAQSIIHESIESFICKHCGRAVAPAESGTRNRNHCPYCLYSCHLDLRPGDRRSGCRALMQPVGIWVQPDGEWSLLHRCERCGVIRSNRIAGDDSERALLKLALKAVTALPFPLEAECL